MDAAPQSALLRRRHNGLMVNAVPAPLLRVAAARMVRGAIAHLGRYRLGCGRPLPFFLAEFDNAVEEVFGKSVSRLAEVADVFEVMTYHQILKR